MDDFVILKARDYSKGNLQKSHPIFNPLITDAGGKRGYAEYSFVINKDSDYELYSIYASGEMRPTEIYIDSQLRKRDGLNKSTGGWTAKNINFFKELEIYFTQGEHYLEIKRGGVIPHIKEFVFLVKGASIEKYISTKKKVKLGDDIHVSAGRIIIPPEIKDIILSKENRKMYPKLLNYSEYDYFDVIGKNNLQLPQNSKNGNYVYLYGENSEVHRWGTDLDEDDFYKQIDKFKYQVENKLDCQIVIGVRRTNFYKLNSILNFVKRIQGGQLVTELPVFNLVPFKGIKRRFYDYIRTLNVIIHSENIEFRIVDNDLDKLLSIIEDSSCKNSFNENGILRALGPVCKDVFIGPYYLLLNLCGFCNTDCIYCRKFSPLVELKDRKEWMHGKQLMDIDMVRKVLREAKDMKTETILIVGEGEPTLYPHFAEALELIKKYGFNFNISTNGMLLDKFDNYLIDGSCSQVTFSMSYASEKTFSKLRPDTDLKWANVIEGNIKRLSTLGKNNRVDTPEIVLLHAIYRDNYKEIIDMAVKAKELGADTIWYQLVHLEDFSYDKLRLNDFQMGEVKKSLEEARNICVKEGIKFHSFIDFELEHYSPEKGDWSKGGLLKQGCYVGWHFAFIELQDFISFCCGQKAVGLLNKDKSFKEWWYSDVYRRYRNDGIIMHKENPLDLYGKPLYDKFCDSCDNHDQNVMMIALLKNYDLFDFVER